jgi:endonuclease YncB( thermonuclease family)
MIRFDRWTYAARIVGVHDGDTVRAEIDLGFDMRFTTTLRLAGIQAPEVGGPGVTDAEKVAGAQATTALLGMIVSGSPAPAVYVVTSKDAREGRGRYLARLLIDLGPTMEPMDVGVEMIRRGFAVAYDGKGKAPKWPWKVTA